VLVDALAGSAAAGALVRTSAVTVFGLASPLTDDAALMLVSDVVPVILSACGAEFLAEPPVEKVIGTSNSFGCVELFTSSHGVSVCWIHLRECSEAPMVRLII